MMLAERIEQLRTAVVAAGDDYQLKLQTGELVSLHDRLRAAADEVLGLAAAVHDLRAGGVWVGDAVMVEAPSVARSIMELSDTVKTLRFDSSLDGPKAQVRLVEGFVKRMREGVKAAWAATLASDTALVDDALVEALHRGGADVEELRQALAGAESALFVLSNRSIPRHGDMARLKAAFLARRGCAERVRDLVPSAVADVILGAQNEDGVPLSLMTNDILGELDRLGIGARFRVILK